MICSHKWTSIKGKTAAYYKAKYEPASNVATTAPALNLFGWTIQLSNETEVGVGAKVTVARIHHDLLLIILKTTPYISIICNTLP